MPRSQETLLRRHLKRHGISIDQYRIWVGAKAGEPVEHFFVMNPDWDVSRWKALVWENATRVRAYSAGSEPDVDSKVGANRA